MMIAQQFARQPARRGSSAVPCHVSEIRYSNPEYERFWFNLALSISFWPDWELEALVDDAAMMTELHMRQNIFCSLHGRQYSANGACPCSGHPGGVHSCIEDPRLSTRPPVTERRRGCKHRFEWP